MEMQQKIVPALENRNHPEILYWFWDENTLENRQYMRDIERICRDTCFDLIFFTARGKLDFYHDRDRLAPAFAEVADYAHAHHVKVGLQLWRDHTDVTDDTAISLLVEGEQLLDADGSTSYRAIKCGDRDGKCRNSTLFAAYVMDKIAPGVYRPGSLEEVTDRCTVTSPNPDTVDVNVDLGPEYADKTIYFLTAHAFQSPDLYTDYYEKSFRKIIGYYRDIPFDGVGLDEFKSINIIHAVEIFQKGIKFRQRLYGKGFARYYEEKTGTSLRDCILDMRWIPEGEDSRRMAAINRYFDVLKDNVIKVENFVADEARRTYGDGVFHGLHNTYHNSLSNDEIWQTGCMWWDLPREYGQTDEDICYPVRMGICCSHPKPVLYDMYYAKTTPECIYEKAMRDARYGVRIHYHAYHDVRPHRFDMENDEFLDNMRKIETRIRLLNALNLPRPQMDLLVVFGRPALTNWYPHAYLRNSHDINGGLFIMEKCDELWNAGVICALVPSAKIDSGILTIDCDGKICYNGHVFHQMLFIGPEYSKPETLAFLLRAARSNPVFIDGIATHDFDGQDCTAQFEEIAKYAKVHPFDLKWLLENGIRKNAVPNGAVLEDGTIVLTDSRSVLSGKPEHFDIQSKGHRFTGTYVGVVALHTDENGEIDRFACGGFDQMLRDGEPYCQVDTRCDLLWDNRTGEMTLVSDNNQNQLHFVQR
ncbi:MAG: hypothetical protein ACOX6P_07195 [Candidatus Merdivicinus sp.]|jgi:hypothetical protein